MDYLDDGNLNENNRTDQVPDAEKQSLLDIKQRRFAFYKNLSGENKNDDFDYKAYEKKKRLKSFLFWLPFEIICFIIPVFLLLFFFLVFLLIKMGVI